MIIRRGLAPAQAFSLRRVCCWIMVGGKEDAWLYRRDHREAWERAGALPWARGVVAEARRARKR